MTQGAVARTEKREDMLLSTLNSYVRAIGGRLDVVVTFDNGTRVTVNLGEITDDTAPPTAA